MILPILGGPTGSGKTAVSLHLDPDRFEIVSFDSRQVYRELSVGTTAPTPEEQKHIPHHLIGFLSANEAPNASLFCKWAETTIESIASRGKIPFLVGGTGFYLRAFLFGMFPVPNVPESTKEYVNQLSLDEATKILQEKDPKALQSLFANDGYRIRRALEVVLSGSLWSEVSQKLEGGYLEKRNDLQIVGRWLDPPREILYKRINDRIPLLIEGMLEETKFVREKYGDDVPGLRTLGYNFALDFLNGKLERNTFIEELAQSHRNYAKRQVTWFKKDPILSPISYEEAVQLYTNIE